MRGAWWRLVGVLAYLQVVTAYHDLDVGPDLDDGQDVDFSDNYDDEVTYNNIDSPKAVFTSSLVDFEPLTRVRRYGPGKESDPEGIKDALNEMLSGRILNIPTWVHTTAMVANIRTLEDIEDDDGSEPPSTSDTEELEDYTKYTLPTRSSWIRPRPGSPKIIHYLRDDNTTSSSTTKPTTTPEKTTTTTTTTSTGTTTTTTSSSGTTSTTTSSSGTTTTTTRSGSTSSTTTKSGQTTSTTTTGSATTGSTTTGSTTTGSTTTKKSSNGTTTTTTMTTTGKGTSQPKFNLKALLALIANLTADYDTNLTRRLNESLWEFSIPTCATPTTTVETTTAPPDYSLVNATIMGKCFVCGLDTLRIPQHAHCADAFAGDFLPLTPVDTRAKGQIANFRKYCRYRDVKHYITNSSQPRSIFGRWTGGCSVRWIDVSGVYTQRSCRNRDRPVLGMHYVSKRMAKLELALTNLDNGCIVSPMATLVPLSRGISLFARFHACVCTGNWCNKDSALIPEPLTLTLMLYIVAIESVS